MMEGPAPRMTAYDEPAMPKAPASPSPMHSEFGELEDALQRLEQATEQLWVDTQYVHQPDHPSAGAIAEMVLPDEPVLSPLATRLHGATGRVNHIVGRLNALARKLDV